MRRSKKTEEGLLKLSKSDVFCSPGSAVACHRLPAGVRQEHRHTTIFLGKYRIQSIKRTCPSALHQCIEIIP